METVWNKDVNVTSTLFPNSQSLVVQRLDEQTSASMNLAENIVTAQLEQFRLNEGGKDNIHESHNEGVNEWSTVHNAPGSPKSDSDVGDQVSSKQCHDNNNNNAKSKAQPTSELKRSMQKIATKISSRKASDQSVRKQAGSSLKESCAISKQGSKDKDESVDSSIIDNKTSTPAADSKRISAGITPKLSDKCGKFNGHNRQLITGRGSQTKEQQIYKQHFSTLNDSGNRNKLPAEGSDDKSKSSATKFRSSRCESDKKSNEIGEAKCHKVQVTRTQSYNVQYNANKALIKSQQRYLRNTTRVDEENSVKHTSGFNNNINVSSPAETVSKKKCENPQTAMNKQISDTRFGQSGSAIGSKDFNVPECGTNERNLMKASNSMQCKKSYQNLSGGKTSADRSVKDDQGSAQKFKKNISTYRSTTGAAQALSKDLHGKVRTDEQKKTIAENNPVKDFKVTTRPCAVDTKARAPPEGSRITVYPHKTVNGASNTNKTDTSGSSSVNNVQSVKSLNSCSNSTKDSTAVDTSTARTSQEPQILQAACNGTEVQLVKTEQEDTCNNNSNNKAASINTETGSVTYSENVQEVNMVDHSAMSYIDNSVQPAKLSSDQFYSDLQGGSTIANAQQMENHQGVQNKSYYNQNNAQYSNMSASIQNPERDLYLLDVAQQKSEQATHVSQSVPSHSNCNPAISIGNGVPYQNMSAVYLNQYTNAQTVPRKTADTAIVSHSAMVPNSSSYTMDSQSMMQSEPTSILMHNSQTSVLPPPGFHNHPVSSQHSQWSLPLPDMYLYGNLMNPGSPLNMQIPNSRQLCNADYNSIQQGYLQHPLFYVPQMCMQGWNPLLQYPAAMFQNPYSNCGTYPNQVLPQSSLADTMSCTVPASVQSNSPFKQFLQLQQLESNPSFSVPSAKLESYPGNVHAGKASSVRMKGSCMNVRSGQYRAPISSEYQNCSQDAQVTSPYSYAVAMDSIARNSPSSVHMQPSQKYPSRALTAANYQRMPDGCSAYQSHQDTGRKDDIPKADTECIPPMVSPRDCMYYGVNYSRNTDAVQSLPARAAAKPVAYTHPVSSQHYNPHYQRHATYQTSPKELTSRAPIGRGIRKSMEQ